MKAPLFIFAAASLALGAAAFAGTAKPHYAITNNDNPGANTATVFKLTGRTLTVSQTLQTGGMGLGTGYFSNSRAAIQSNGKCLFLSDGGSNDIASFQGKYNSTTGELTFPRPPSRIASGGTASIEGIGLAATPDGKLLFASLDVDEKIAIFTIGPQCELTAQGTTADLGDNVGPMGITNDGKVLIVPGPNQSFVDAFTISDAPPYLVPLGSQVQLNSVIPSCHTVRCFPAGVAISDVDGNGNATIVLGNRVQPAPYFITMTMNEIAGIFALSANNFPITTPDNPAPINVESPFYSSAGVTGNGFIYFSAGGAAHGGTAGLYVNSVMSEIIITSALSSYYNSAAFYCGNVQSTGQRAVQQGEFLWQSCADSAQRNTEYVYQVSPQGIARRGISLANPNAQGNTFVFSTIAWPVP